MTALEPRPAVEAAALSAGEVRRRAAAGIAVVGMRGVAIRLLSFGGTVVLARLLLPRDFGLVAFGMTLMASASFLSDAGIGAALIRRREPPEREDLEALLAFQLVVSLALASLAAALAAPFGELGRITALMGASLPLVAVRAPTVILLERALSYRPLVFAEICETLAFYGWAIATVAAGWGVWGLASAAIARSATGSGVLLAVAPVWLRPRISWLRVRSLLSFGARYQAVGLTNLVRDQGLNIGTAAIAGVAVLGLWNFASRILQIPFLLFTSLWRVSYPAMSRLVAAGEEPRPIVERGIALAAVGTGILLTPLVGAGPAIVPTVLGHHWHATIDILPWASLGLMISGPVSVAAAGYLYAVGDASTPLRSTILHTVAWQAVAFTLLPVVGVAALGLGWLAGALVDAFVLGRGAARRCGAKIVPALALPTSLAAAAGGAGWALASSTSPSLGAAALAGGAAEAIYVGGLLLARRGLLVDLCSAAGQALRASLAGT